MINTIDEKTQKALDAVLKQVEFKTIKKKDVLDDLISATRAFEFHLLIGSALLEKLEKRDAEEQSQEESK